MDNLTVDGWCKVPGAENPIPLEDIRFYISPACHLELEAAEEELLKTKALEKFVDVNIDTLKLEVPSEVGLLSDCGLRVYLGPLDNRGQFHIVGHRASDNSLVYTNSVMVDQLG
ncbi:MAG: hypothetical protein QNK31_08120 [Porticoccus sp.]|nr:hypothetical protein [Porticoccus sp.]